MAHIAPRFPFCHHAANECGWGDQYLKPILKGDYMIKKTLLISAAVVLAASAAYAGPKVAISQDHRTVSVAPGKGTAGSLVQFPGTEAYSNFAKKYPNGLYFCCYGYTISGPSSFLGAAYAAATQWTQDTDADVTKLSAAVGYVSGDHTATLHLYADSGSDTDRKSTRLNSSHG